MTKIRTNFVGGNLYELCRFVRPAVVEELRRLSIMLTFDYLVNFVFEVSVRAKQIQTTIQIIIKIIESKS